jgi:multiple sugar transport system substrate-binding protein
MKKVVFVLLILMFIIGTISAAGRTETSATGEKKVVKMWTFLNPEGATSGRNLALKKIIEQFEAENPNISIVVEPQQWDVMTNKFFAAHQAGNAPDIMWVISYDLGTAIEQGMLADLESLFLDDWSAEEIADIDDAFFEWGETNGKHYQITHSRNYFALIYRKDLLEKAGVQLPFKGWDDMVQAAVKMTGVDPATGMLRYGLGQSFGLGKVDPPIFTYDALTHQDDIFNADGTANWTTPEMVRAVSRMSDMVKRYKVTPEEAVTFDIEDVYQDFMAGKYAMITAASVRVPTLRAGANFDPSTIEIIHYPGDGTSDFGRGLFSGWAVSVWSKSKVIDEAGMFLEYMMSPEADKLWVMDGGQVPIRKSTITALGDFFGKPENDYLRVTAEGFANYCYATPTAFPIPSWREDLNAVAQDVIYNNTAPLAALQKMQNEFNARVGK